MSNIRELFKSLDERRAEAISQMPSTMLKAFAILLIAGNEYKVERLYADEIEKALDEIGVNAKKLSIARSLARAGDRVKTEKGKDGLSLYKIMKKGEREVEPHLKTGNIEVMYIDGSTPRTDRQMLSDILENLRGIVRICDPYFGHRSLDAVDCIPKTCAVRFLIGQNAGPGRQLSNALKDLAKERPTVEIRQYARPREMHDRYILTDDLLLIVGHGLKDIGGKESFIVKLNAKLIPDLIQQTRQSFETKWTDSSPVK